MPNLTLANNNLDSLTIADYTAQINQQLKGLLPYYISFENSKFIHLNSEQLLFWISYFQKNSAKLTKLDLSANFLNHLNFI